jgi:flavin reductase (DIM6/NTAB) family NADH-FMN oxidoreductase RutF
MTGAMNVNRLLEGLDYPVFVVTTAHEGERAGCLVGFVTQTSIDPPRLLVCLSVQNHTYTLASRADTLAMHLLASHQRELATLFGSTTGDEIDKFGLCQWGRTVRAACRFWAAAQAGWWERFSNESHSATTSASFSNRPRCTGRRLRQLSRSSR